jgi:hypothetical protein
MGSSLRARQTNYLIPGISLANHIFVGARCGEMSAGAILVGRLTGSLPLAWSIDLPVYVARVPAAPFCETPIE